MSRKMPKMPEKGLLGSLYNVVVGPSAGATSSEFAGAAGAGAVITTLPIPEDLKAKLLASLAAVYTVVRGIIKIVEVWKGRPAAPPAAATAEPPVASPAKSAGAAALLLSLVLPSLILAGCQSTNPYEDALYRFGETGRGVQPMLREPADDSERALQDAFDAAVAEALKVRER